ncbi:MAG: hypothetical protein LBT86_03095 [Deltaproteobacteria bacterium]|nr:hypothetical protein [Deltaproteobacteria bacterium]
MAVGRGDPLARRAKRPGLRKKCCYWSWFGLLSIKIFSRVNHLSLMTVITIMTVMPVKDR